MWGIEHTRFLSGADMARRRQRTSDNETRRENLWIYAAAGIVMIMVGMAIWYAARG
jgi:hypothetical protein